MKRDQFIIITKKGLREFMGLPQKMKLQELKDEGIDAEIIPWIEDKN